MRPAVDSGAPDESARPGQGYFWMTMLPPLNAWSVVGDRARRAREPARLLPPFEPGHREYADELRDWTSSDLTTTDLAKDHPGMHHKDAAGLRAVNGVMLET